MRELAVQSANGTNSATDRASIQLEAAQLELEITRISQNTTFAGQAILDGSLSGGTTVATFQIGADSGQILALTVPEMSTAGATIGYVSALTLGTMTLAGSAITQIDAALSGVASVRADIASKMNRLDHTIANLDNVVTNLSQAKGRIEDADFASETGNLAKNQILQQAATAMVAQANASKNTVLNLLRN